MKYFKTYEKFKKSYMTKIDLKDFKKIKKGSKVLYMGGQVEVLKNDGYVLTLKGKDGKKFTVNKAMFDHGGQINEGVLDNITLMADASKDYEDFKKKFKKGFPKIFKPTPDFMDWLYGMYKDMAPDKVEEGIVDDLVAMGAQIDYLYDADPKTQKIWKKAGFDPNDEDNVILYSYVNSWPETKKMLDKKRVKYKELEDPNSAGESYIVFKESLNELNTDGAIMNLWKKLYGEDFVSEYPAVAKILKVNRKNIDRKELARIWDETYGEDLKDKYPDFFKALK